MNPGTTIHRRRPSGKEIVLLNAKGARGCSKTWLWTWLAAGSSPHPVSHGTLPMSSAPYHSHGFLKAIQLCRGEIFQLKIVVKISPIDLQPTRSLKFSEVFGTPYWLLQSIYNAACLQNDPSGEGIISMILHKCSPR